MPRRNLNKYSPVEDSTPGFRTTNPKALVLNIKGERGCPCGCEETPKGKKAVFVMGHDARLRGKLQRAHLTDTKVLILRDGQPERKKLFSAMEVAKRYGESFVKGLQEAVDHRTKANHKVLNKALNSERMIKVGRAKFTGQVVAIYEAKNGKGEEFEIEYVTKTGQTKRTRVPAKDAPLAAKA
jgi:hypothetical protein